MPDKLRIEIAYADPVLQILRVIELPIRSTVSDALSISGIAKEIGTRNIAADRIGIFSRPVQLDTKLRDGDRIEIYRELRADPKESRRRRARENSVKP